MNNDDLERIQRSPRDESSPVIPHSQTEQSEVEPIEGATSAENRPMAQTEKPVFEQESAIAEGFSETETEGCSPTLKRGKGNRSAQRRSRQAHSCGNGFRVGAQRNFN